MKLFYLMLIFSFTGLAQAKKMETIVPRIAHFQ